MTKKLYAELSYWQRLATQSDMVSKFIVWWHNKKIKQEEAIK